MEEQLQGLVLAPQTVVISAGACLYASSLHNLQFHHRAKQGRYHGSKDTAAIYSQFKVWCSF